MRIVRLKPYLSAMKAMGLDDAAMRRIESSIVDAPQASPVLKGLRGVRKIRFARPGSGKSGGGRAIYYALMRRDTIFMLTAYPKNVQEDLTSADRRAIMSVLETISGGEA